MASGEVGVMGVVGSVPFDSRQRLLVPCAVLCVGNDLAIVGGCATLPR